jgi:hypothetical protein
LIAESCTLQNCLSFLVFDQICSCHMIIISVLIHGGVHMRNCGVSSSMQSRCKAVGAEIHSSLVK